MNVSHSSQLALLPGRRRPLTPAPSEGPLSDPGRLPLDVMIPLGGQTVETGERGRGAPLLPPSPAPSPKTLYRIPYMYANPNHYLFPPNSRDRGVETPAARIPDGRQYAYELRQNYRRPATIEQAPITP